MAVYSHDNKLFVNKETEEPMKFVLRPCPERVRLKKMVEHGGGHILTHSIHESAIQLALPEDKVISDNVYSSVYITDCCVANTLLDKEKYRVTPGDKSVFDIDIEDSPTSGIIQLQAQDKKGRRRYNLGEEHAIIRYIAEEYKHTEVKGNALWQTMEKLEITPHTWQSMKDHYHNIILPRLGQYNIKPLWKKRLRADLGLKTDEELDHMVSTSTFDELIDAFGPKRPCEASEDKPTLSPDSLLPKSSSPDAEPEDIELQKTLSAENEACRSSSSGNGSPRKRNLYTQAGNKIEILQEPNDSRNKSARKARTSNGRFASDSDNSPSRNMRSKTAARSPFKAIKQKSTDLEGEKGAYSAGLKTITSSSKPGLLLKYSKNNEALPSENSQTSMSQHQLRSCAAPSVSPKSSSRGCEESNREQTMIARRRRRRQAAEQEVTFDSQSTESEEDSDDGNVSQSLLQGGTPGLTGKRKRNLSSSSDEISFKMPNVEAHCNDEEETTSVEEDLHFVQKCAKKVGLRPRAFFSCLMMHSGSVKDAIQWIKYGKNCQGENGWMPEDDDLLLNDEDSYDFLVEKYGEDSVQKRALFLNDIME